MEIPIVSFVCWNRAGLNARNLLSLLETTDDFELHIVDSASTDDTWRFLRKVSDPRIKEIKRMSTNKGCTYNLNYVLAQRKKNQYFIHIDSDTQILTKSWVSEFMKVMNEFPEVGLVSTAEAMFFDKWEEKFKIINRNGVEFLAFKYITGWCCCIRPEIFDLLGYFNEETYFNDIDIRIRIDKFTKYSMGFTRKIKIDQSQRISCEECPINKMCILRVQGKNCFNIHEQGYLSNEFMRIYRQRQRDFLKEIEKGERDIYCASIHDKESIKNHYYNISWAEKNFEFYERIKR